MIIAWMEMLSRVNAG